MLTFTEDMQIVELELFDAAFAVSPGTEDDVRRRYMTLFVAPSTKRYGANSEILRACTWWLRTKTLEFDDNF